VQPTYQNVHENMRARMYSAPGISEQGAGSAHTEAQISVN
jgi:hypothetical protein